MASFSTGINSWESESTAPGLSVLPFVVITVVILIANVAAVTGYKKFIAENPEKAVSVKIAELVKLEPDIVTKLRYGKVGLIVLSWIFSVSVSSACTFIELGLKTPVFSGFGSPSSQPQESVYYGFRGGGSNGECVTGLIEDIRVLTAMLYAALNCILTTIAMISMSLMVCNMEDVEMAKRRSRRSGLLMLASTWCCQFTFYIQESVLCGFYESLYATSAGRAECSLGGAGVAQVFNLIFMIIICVLFLVLPSPGDEGDEDANEGDGNTDEPNQNSMKVDMTGQLGRPGQVETEIHLPDGTIKRKIETTNPDGSKTVTNTIEHPLKKDEENGKEIEHSTNGRIGQEA